MNTEEASPAADVTRMPLKALGLRTGMALQTRRLVEGANKKESQFFGAIEGKGVMVGPLGVGGEKTGLEPGEICVVRGFTGVYEYSFLSKVLQTFEKPFAYALLAYPAQVDARKVRQSLRTKVAWPTTALLPDAAGAPTQRQPVTLVDVSLQGAMVQCATPLAAVGADLTLEMVVQVDDTDTVLRITASVCHANRPVGETAVFIGVAFKNLTQQDKLVLSYATQSAAAAASA